jgi:hypothetical protein
MRDEAVSHVDHLDEVDLVAVLASADRASETPQLARADRAAIAAMTREARSVSRRLVSASEVPIRAGRDTCACVAVNEQWTALDRCEGCRAERGQTSG